MAENDSISSIEHPMSSPVLQRKLAKMRQAAPQELPKVRLCADLVHALATGAGEGVVNDALAKLKACAGRNWAARQAAQYLSGQQAEFAIEFASP